MEDEYGRPLSDNGQWVWDGAAWRPTGGGVPSGPGTGGYEPTMVAPRSSPGPAGGPQLPAPWYWKPSVLIGALFVLSAVLVTTILLTRGGNDSAGPPVESPTILTPTAAPTTPPASPSPTPTPTPPPPATITPGIYDCTSGGTQIGRVNFAGTAYTTDTGASGTYLYDESTGDVSFTGPDLGAYTGTYDPAGPSMDLSTSEGDQLHCAE